ncbi:hypothetical protein JQC67_03995 [Aurantibacter crassamenti]|uniref:tetratricopeptide repeat protein n=1 Tax=Aurantibacter crassamenti TaxID=1837375 RepID=UPI00193AC5D7|nr:hypothetical protein [Aurantibacter crassamenti]MBM1105296.1 hypothetical protein [Aurantibacter crassamenti]
MKKATFYLICVFGFISIPQLIYAQEESPDIDVEESAEVFLEEYSDAFQENFFEALKQKGIENYDRAINLLLECKQLQPNNSVVDYELAKAYLLNIEFVAGQEYAIIAVNSEPDNLWYLNTLVTLVQKQGNTIESIKSQLSFSDKNLKENLALIYYKQKKYEKALEILGPLDASTFTEELESKINSAIKRVGSKPKSSEIKSKNTDDKNVSIAYKSEIESLILADSNTQLLSLSKEALDNYPLQPYFYYANGFSLIKIGKHKEAIDVLEAGIDYLLDDDELANKIYSQLAEAYTAIGNSVKANMYLSKVKPRF